MNDTPYQTLPHSKLRRAVDLAVAVPLLTVSAAFLAPWVLPLTKRNLGGNPFFNQERYGEGGQVFTMHKLKSMKNETGPDGTKLADAERHTKWGKFLRKSSIDEVPQLWNVIKGEMTLVGPRPMWVKVAVQDVPNWAERCAVRPGLTGIAQLRPNSYSTPLEQRFAIDAHYVQVRAENPFFTRLLHDVGVILDTAVKVVRGGRADTATVMDYGAKRSGTNGGSAKPKPKPEI